MDLFGQRVPALWPASRMPELRVLRATLHGDFKTVSCGSIDWPMAMWSASDLSRSLSRLAPMRGRCHFRVGRCLACAHRVVLFILQSSIRSISDVEWSSLGVAHSFCR